MRRRLLEAGSAVRSPVPDTSIGYLGDLVAWTFGDASSKTEFSVPRAVVRQAFDDAGFLWQRCLPDPTAASVLLGAERSGGVKPGPELLVKEMPRPEKDTPVALCVYHREQRDGEVGDEWRPGARVRLEGDRAVVRPLADEALTLLPECQPLADAIAARANHLMTHVCNQELSGALVAAGKMSSWAAFRRGTGGAYWVPSSGADRFRRLLDALEQHGGFWPVVQPLFADGDGRTQRNVADAASAAIAQALAQITRELSEEKDMTSKQAEGRITKCRELLVRASLYREALRDKLDETRAAIEEAMAKFEKVISMDDDESVFEDAMQAAANG